MNAALMSFVRQWMNDNDREKEKKEQRRYNEEQRQVEWNREDTQKMGDRKYRESVAAKQDLDKLKQTTLDSEWLSRYGKDVDISKGSTWELTPDLAKEVVRKAVAEQKALQDVALVREALQIDPSLSDEQVALLYPQLDTSNVLQGTTSLEGIRRGLPKSTVDTSLATQSASRASSDLSRTKDEAALPKAGEVVRSSQTAQLLQDRFGGRSPSTALIPDKSNAYTVVNADTGEVEIVENPYANRLVKDPLQGMITGNSALEQAAIGLGFEKRPMKFDASGRPERVARPATATPSAFMPKFSGNLATDTGRTDFGKSTLNEALDAAGVLVTPEGTVQAKPVTVRYPYSPFATSNRDPNEEEAEARRQRAIQIINYYQKNRQ